MRARFKIPLLAGRYPPDTQPAAGGFIRLGSIVKTKHFRSALAAALALITVVYLGALGVLYAQYRTARRQSAEAAANRLALAVQEQLSAMRTNAVFTGSIKTVERLMAVEQPDNSSIAGVVGELGPFMNHSSYESVQLFFAGAGRIYVSGVGMYDWEDYFDQPLLAALDGSAAMELWWFDSYSRYYGDQYPMHAVTYARATPIYGQERYGYVAISVPVAHLRSVTAGAAPPELPYTAVFFEGHMLFSTSDAFGGAYDEALGYSENARAFHGPGRLLEIRSTSETAVTVVCALPVGQLNGELAGAVPLLCLIYLGLCVASLVCALLYSGAMLRSVDRIMCKFGTYNVVGAAGRRNEFDLLGLAVDRLKGQMTAVERTVQRNLPLVRERLVNKLICTQLDPREALDGYGEYGIDLPHPYFLVVIVSMPELAALTGHAARERLALVAQREAEEALGALGKAYGTYGEGHSLLLLLNTPDYEGIEERVRAACRGFCARLFADFSLSPLISVGICSPERPVPHHAFIQARRNLIYTYADQEEFLLFSSQSEYTPVVDDALLGRLVQGVIDRSAAALGDAAGLFAKAYVDRCPDLRQAQRLCEICACAVFTRLLEMNLDAGEAPLEACLHKIAAADTPEACGRELHAYLLSLLGAEQKISDKSQRYVHEAIAFIERNYAEDLSIPQIAANCAVNPVYLNKLFKLSTGKTVSEYLNSFRIGVARQLLEGSDETVAAISARVGYHDTRSFIRFFKKFHQVTPNEYRKQCSGINGAQ